MKWTPALKVDQFSDNDTIRPGDKIKIYGKETTVTGFYGTYNDGLEKWETIILTEGRGDPFERSIDVIEVQKQYPPVKSPTTADASVLVEALQKLIKEYSGQVEKYIGFSKKPFGNAKANEMWRHKSEGLDRAKSDLTNILAQYNALPGSQGGEKRKLQFMGKGLADVMDAAHNAAIKEAQIIVGQNLIPRHSVVEPIIKGILEKLEAIKRQSTLPNQIEDNSNFRGEVIGTIAYNPVSGDLRITPDPEPDQREDKTDMGVYENYQRETTIAQSPSSIEESGLKEGDTERYETRLMLQRLCVVAAKKDLTQNEIFVLNGAKDILTKYAKPEDSLR